MNTLTLFDVPKDSPSRKERIALFKQTHGIETHYCRGMEAPWLACHMPSARKFGYGVTEESDLVDCMAKVGRLLDGAGVSVDGTTEREAISQLCKNLKIPCDL